MVSQIYLLLHNIRSTYNVGSIFRIADATGVSKIYLSGYTPAPIDRFGRVRKDIAKVSLGAERSVTWESVGDMEKLIRKLKKQKFLICAIEQDEKSIDFRKIPKKDKILLILGNEVDGVEQGILNSCDIVAEIPMFGSKESLNVSVSVGIVLYSLLE